MLDMNKEHEDDEFEHIQNQKRVEQLLKLGDTDVFAVARIQP